MSSCTTNLIVFDDEQEGLTVCLWSKLVGGYQRQGVNFAVGLATSAFAKRPRCCGTWTAGFAIVCDVSSGNNGRHSADAGQLLKRGIKPELAHTTAFSSKGPWRVSDTPGVRMALDNRFFDRMGLIRLRPH